MNFVAISVWILDAARRETASVRQPLGRQVAVYLLAGAVMSYAVAWICQISAGRFPNEVSFELSCIGRGPLRMDALSGCPGVSGCRVYPRHKLAEPLPDGADDVPYWMDNPMWGLDEPDARSPSAYWWSAGVPFRCCRGVKAYTTSSSSQSRGIVVWEIGAEDVWVPLEPWWPGLIANSASFAALLWFGPRLVRLTGAWAYAPFRAIRKWRLRRACCCPCCAYDLRGLSTPNCPECGAERPIIAATG
jgi:hypothetical protein